MPSALPGAQVFQHQGWTSPGQGHRTAAVSTKVLGDKAFQSSRLRRDRPLVCFRTKMQLTVLYRATSIPKSGNPRSYLSQTPSKSVGLNIDPLRAALFLRMPAVRAWQVRRQRQGGAVAGLLASRCPPETCSTRMAVWLEPGAHLTQNTC